MYNTSGGSHTTFTSQECTILPSDRLPLTKQGQETGRLCKAREVLTPKQLHACLSLTLPGHYFSDPHRATLAKLRDIMDKDMGNTE